MTELQTVESSSEDHQLEIKSEETSESHGKDIIELKDTSDEVEAKCSAKEKTDNSESAPKGIFALKKELEHEDTTAKDVAKSKLARVTINVVGARNLSKTSKFGKADPYVLVSYDDKKFKSVKVSNSSNPEWNFVITVYVDKESTAEFSVEVFDEDTFTKDDFLGRVSLKSQDLSRLQQGQWIPLEGCKSGEILISAEIVDDVEGEKEQSSSSTTMSKKNDEEAEIKTIIILEKKAKLPEHPDDTKPEKAVSQDEKISDVEKISTESASEMMKKTTELMREDAYFANVSDVTDKEQNEEEAEKEKPSNANDKTGIAVAVAAAASVAAASIGGQQVVEDIKISFDSTDEANDSKAGSEITETTVESGYKAEGIKETRMDEQFEEDSARWDLSPEKIELTVYAARDLPKKGMFGKADPYVVISLGDQKLKSATINNTYNPQWDLKTTLHVQPNAPRDISIVVLDEDVGKDDLVGEIFLNIDDLLKVGGLKDAWVPLGGCKSGEVQISSSIQWEESQSTTSDNQNLTPLATLTDKSKSPTPTILITSAPDAQIDLSDDEEEYENVTSQKSKNAESKNEVPEHKEDQDLDSKTVVGTIEDPAISVAAKEVVDAVTAKAVEKVAAIAKAEDEEKQHKKQAALEDPKIISAARKVVDQATSDAVEKVAAMQAGHPAVVIGGPTDQTVDSMHDETPDVSGAYKTKELLQGEVSEEVIHESNKGQKTDRITFTLNSAKDLINTDYIGKSDPYARISFGSFVCRTSTKKNDLSPHWNHLVTLNVESNSPSSIDIELFDEDTLGQDKSLGRTSIDVSEIKSSLITTRASRKLEGCDSGEITYSARFTTATELPEDLTSEEPKKLLVTSDLGIERTSFKEPSDAQAQVQGGKTDSLSESTFFAETSTTIESQESTQSISSKSTATQDNKFEFGSKQSSSTSEFIQTQTGEATSLVETSTRKVAKLSQESCKIESHKGNQSKSSQSIETQNNKVEFTSEEASSASELLQIKTVVEDAKKDDIRKQQETESTISRITSTTMTQKESSEKKLDIVETKSILERDVTMEIEEEPKALPKQDGETEDDLERKKEKKPENQATGVQETQRLLQGEQMEEKYPAPGVEGKPESEIQSDLERHKEKQLENQSQKFNP